VLKRVAEDTPRDIREIIPETPRWLCDIIAKLHAKDPAGRYQSAREVADVLADCEAQLRENAKLKDFSRIPRGKPPVVRRRRSGVMLLVIPLAAILVLGAIGSVAVVGVLWLLAPVNGDGQPNGKPELSQVVVTPGSDPSPIVLAKKRPLPLMFKNNIGMEFVIVPKGKSWLGGGKDKLGDKEVVFHTEFYLGKYEVTQE
jgi:serine/threonine protein kinase